MITGAAFFRNKEGIEKKSTDCLFSFISMRVLALKGCLL